MSTANPAREAVATVPVRETGYIDSTSRVSRPMKTILWHILLASIAIVMAFPFVAMLLMAFRPESVVALSDILFSDQFTLDNFRMNLRNDSMVRWIFNSFVYSLVSVVLVLLLASMAGYAFAKKEFFARDKIFWLFVAMLVVPSQVTLVPLFILLVQLDGANTYWGLIVPTLANAQGVFLMRQYIRGIPDDLIEAAKLDGASEFRIFWQIILPLTIPVQATLGIFVFLWHWNDFLWPLVSQQSPGNYVLTVGLNTLQEQQVPLATLMASAVVTFIPALLVFIFLQRYFVRGVMMSGIK